MNGGMNNYKEVNIQSGNRAMTHIYKRHYNRFHVQMRH
jgi:hypothetical protein